MEKKLTHNYLYSVIYQLLIVITPFITTPYLTRVMGITALSINDFTGNIVQWFVLFGIMGINIYGNREIARVRDDKNLMSKTFFEIFAMQVLNMCLSMIAFFLFLFVFRPEYLSILYIQSITLLSVCFDITWFFYGVEDFKKASIRNMSIKILNVALILLLIKSPEDLPKFVLLNATLGVAGQLIMWVQLKQYVHFSKVTLKGILTHVQPNLALFIPQIAISVYSMLDITMLGYLYADIDHVNLYRQSQQFIKMFLFFITSLGSVMLPRVANTFVKKDMEAITGYLNKTFRIALYLAIPMIVGINVIIQNFIDWFLPPNYKSVGSLIQIGSMVILFISLSNVYGIQYMIPAGEYKKYTLSVVSGAITNFVLNLILIPHYGAYGAIIASVCAEFLVFMVQWFYMRKILHLHIAIKEMMTVIIASLLMGAGVWAIGIVVPVSFLGNIMQLATGIGIYGGTLLIMKAPLLEDVYALIRKGK